MITKDVKKLALTELEKLKKSLKDVDANIPSIRAFLQSTPLFKRVLFSSSDTLTIFYSNMTLTIYIEDGNILVNDRFGLWSESGVGFVGSFTTKTLKLECSDGLD